VPPLNTTLVRFAHPHRVYTLHHCRLQTETSRTQLTDEGESIADGRDGHRSYASHRLAGLRAPKSAYSTITEVVNVDTESSDFDVFAARPGQRPPAADAARGPTSSSSLTLEELATGEARSEGAPEYADSSRTAGLHASYTGVSRGDVAARSARDLAPASPDDVAAMVRRLRSELDVAKRQLALASSSTAETLRSNGSSY
jgi:hypothetical protein